MPTSSNPPSPAPSKRKFTTQELKSIHDALAAFPATHNPAFIERVMDALNDPGVSLAP